MIALSNILMATDFTRFSRDGREFARALCHRFQARLHLLHVISESRSTLRRLAQRSGKTATSTLKNQFQQQECSEVKLWAELFPDCRKDFEVCFATRFGRANEEILNYANEESIDLIVVGTHGRTGLDRLISGSIAEYLVQHARCPVLTVLPSSAIPESAQPKSAVSTENVTT